jgi:hypothetical protein
MYTAKAVTIRRDGEPGADPGVEEFIRRERIVIREVEIARRNWHVDAAVRPPPRAEGPGTG